MLLTSRILVSVLLIPICALLGYGALISTLHLLASEQPDHTVLLVAVCCYSGLIGFVALLRLTYARNLSGIGEKYVYVSLIFGLASLALFLTFSPSLISAMFSLVVGLLSAYMIWRWHTNKSKQSDGDSAAAV
jgi:uncharacterized membrane protein YfcA